MPVPSHAGAGQMPYAQHSIYHTGSGSQVTAFDTAQYFYPALNAAPHVAAAPMGQFQMSSCPYPSAFYVSSMPQSHVAHSYARTESNSYGCTEQFQPPFAPFSAPQFSAPFYKTQYDFAQIFPPAPSMSALAPPRALSHATLAPHQSRRRPHNAPVGIYEANAVSEAVSSCIFQSPTFDNSLPLRLRPTAIISRVPGCAPSESSLPSPSPVSATWQREVQDNCNGTHLRPSQSQDSESAEKDSERLGSAYRRHLRNRRLDHVLTRRLLGPDLRRDRSNHHDADRAADEGLPRKTKGRGKDDYERYT